MSNTSPSFFVCAEMHPLTHTSHQHTEIRPLTNTQAVPAPARGCCPSAFTYIDLHALPSVRLDTTGGWVDLAPPSLPKLDSTMASTSDDNENATTLSLRAAFYAGLGSNEEEMDVNIVVRLSSNYPSSLFPFRLYPSHPPFQPAVLLLSSRHTHLAKGPNFYFLIKIPSSSPSIPLTQ